MATDVRIRVLGPTEVGSDGTVLSPRDRGILCALCVQPGQVFAADVLADALWGEAPPKSWGKVVQGSVMRLRRSLGPSAIETTAGGYRIVLTAGQLDTVEFEHLVSRGRSFLALHEPERAATTFEQALALWRGAPFPELADWDRARSEGARLLDVRRAVEEDLVEAHLAAGRAVDAASEVRPLVDREPFRERRWALLATALYRTGRQGEALEVLRQAGRTMRDELGLDPGTELVGLEQRILVQDPSLLGVPNRIGGASGTCPYQGLRPFDASDADFYFGRSTIVAEAVRRLGAFPMLLVVGPSGSGKSSLVRAGVLPVLARAGHAASVVTPGTDPMAALTTAVAALRTGGILVVDQLEEVFAGTEGTQTTQPFLDRLAELVEGGTPVVTTLRADYLGWIAESPSLSRLAERGLLLTTALTDSELRAAIEEPARLVGLILEPGLADILVRDVTGAAGGLPLLSHALAETWDHRDGNVLTVEGYRSTGGIHSAVARSAERLYDSLTEPDRETLRAVLQRLITPSPTGDPVVARVPTRVFAGSADAPRLLDLLIRARLVTTSNDSVTIAHESLVRAWPRLRAWLDEDVAGLRIQSHLQAAADTWDTLGRSDEELYRGARLAAAREWRHRTSLVLAPIEVAFLTAATASADAEMLRREHEHTRQVRLNRQLRGALAAVMALLAVALVTGALAGQNGRAAQAAAAMASAEAARADSSAVQAIGARLGATAFTEPDPRLALLLARQAVAISDSPTTQGALLHVLMSAGGLVGLAQAGIGPSPSSFDSAFTSDGRDVLQLNAADEVDILDTTTGFSLHGPLVGTSRACDGLLGCNWGGYPTGLIAGGRIAVIADGSPAKSWGEVISIGLVETDVDSGDPVGPRQRVPGAKSVLGNYVLDHGDRLRISPDGRTLVSVLEGSVRIWHRTGGRWVGPQSVPIPGLEGADAAGAELVGASYSATGDRAAVMFRQGSAAQPATAGVVLDLDRSSPALLSGPDGDISHMAISPDGTRVLVGDRDGLVRVRTIRGDRLVDTIPGQSPATILTWADDGRRMAVGRQNGTTEVFSLDPLQRVMISSGTDQVSALAFVGDNRLVRESITGSIARYDLAALAPVASQASTPPSHAVDSAAGLIVQGEDNGRVTVRDAGTLRQIGEKLSMRASPKPGKPPENAVARRITALAITRDGSAVIAGDRLGHLRMWSLPERELLWSRDDVPTSWLAVSPDGRYLATAGTSIEDGVPGDAPVTSAFTVWDLSRHAQHISEDFTDLQYQVSPGAPQVNRITPTPRAVVFSPDGARVAVAYGEGFVMIYDVALGRRTAWKYLTEPSAIAFAPDGRRLLGANPDYVIEWDSTTGEELRRSLVPGLRDLTRMTYSHDGRWLAISHPRSLSLLDAQTLRVVVADLSVPSVDPTDAFALAAGQGNELIVGTRSVLASIDMDPGHWESAACRLVGRKLTRDEWNRFLPSAQFAPACG